MKTSIKKKLIAIAMASVMVGSTVSGMAVTASTVNYETVSADSSIVSTGAIVSEGTTSDGWDYALYGDGTAGIVKYSGSAKKVTLPNSIDGKSIKCLIEGALKDTSVETLVIPDGTPLPVKYSNRQFTWRCFKNSTNLKEVVIGSMFAEAIPEYSFLYCSKLEKVTFTKDFSKKALEAGSCAIRTQAFEGTAIKSFVVPEGITEIRRNALASTCVENISIPTTIISKMESTENFSNDVDINETTGYNKGIKNIILRGESTLAINYSYDTVTLYCSENSMMKEICDAYDVAYTDLSTINADKMECEWLGIPYQPDVPEVITTTSETVPTSTTETKPTETDVTETTTVSTTTETKPIETTTTETSTTETKPTETDVTETTTTTTNIAKKTTVKLSSYSKNVYVKGKTIIKPIVRNGKGKTTYRSNNTKIAKVNSKGIVTALKSGTAKITVTNNKISKVFTVKVLNPKLNKTSVSIKRGKSFTLKISGKIGTAKFYTSNKKIAKVNKYGKIKVNKKAPKGKTAYITVKTNGVTLKCKVKVK